MKFEDLSSEVENLRREISIIKGEKEKSVKIMENGKCVRIDVSAEVAEEIEDLMTENMWYEKL